MDLFNDEHLKEETFVKDNDQSKKQKKKMYVTLPLMIIMIIIAILISVLSTVIGLRYFGVRVLDVPTKEVTGQTRELSKATNSKLSVEEIISKNANAVVEIRTEALATDNWLSNYVKEGAGSGVIIDKNGYILTCNHVIAGASDINVTLKDGSEHKANLVGADPANDIAVIKISGANFESASYGDSSKLVPGNLVVAIGNPLGKLGGSASAGIISALDREITIGGRKMNLLQTDTAINPGNSGGGLFNGDGNLVGIVVAKSGGENIEGIGFAIPINKAKEIADNLIKTGKTGDRAVIGVKVINIADANAAIKFGVQNTGVYISDITGENAKKAGLKVGDMIYYLGDQRIENTDDLLNALNKYKPKDKIQITVIRNNKTIKIDTVLDKG